MATGSSPWRSPWFAGLLGAGLGVVLSAVGVVVLVPRDAAEPTALQVDPSSPSERALRLKDKAFQHLFAHEYGPAIENLLVAHQLRPHPAFMFNLATAYDRWGDHCADAARWAGEYIKACASCEASEARRPKMQAILEQCTSTVVVESEPLGAHVFVDGVDQGTTPAMLHLTPGPHRVEARLTGYVTATSTLTVEAGRRAELRLALGPAG